MREQPVHTPCDALEQLCPSVKNEEHYSIFQAEAEEVKSQTLRN